jgi:hypothetical protein
VAWCEHEKAVLKRREKEIILIIKEIYGSHKGIPVFRLVVDKMVKTTSEGVTS